MPSGLISSRSESRSRSERETVQTGLQRVGERSKVKGKEKGEKWKVKGLSETKLAKLIIVKWIRIMGLVISKKKSSVVVSDSFRFTIALSTVTFFCFFRKLTKHFLRRHNIYIQTTACVVDNVA